MRLHLALMNSFITTIIQMSNFTLMLFFSINIFSSPFSRVLSLEWGKIDFEDSSPFTSSSRFFRWFFLVHVWVLFWFRLRALPLPFRINFSLETLRNLFNFHSIIHLPLQTLTIRVSFVRVQPPAARSPAHHRPRVHACLPFVCLREKRK